MKFYISSFLYSILFLSVGICCSQTKAQPVFEGSMEQKSIQGVPLGWKLPALQVQKQAYNVELDSVVRMEGRYSLSINQKGEGAEFGVATYTIPSRFKGSEIELKGYLKTENITNGYGGLWLRVDGSRGVLAFDNMSKTALNGTTDWKEYSIKLPYDDEKAINIVLGGLLAGSGKLWMDDLRLYIDGKPIDQAPVKQAPVKVTYQAEIDTAFAKHSGIDTIKLNDHQIQKLVLLGQVWGFLKYNHPAVAKGKYNFDAELFRVMPDVISSNDATSLSLVLEKWVDRLGMPAACKNCNSSKGNKIEEGSTFESMLSSAELSRSLVEKLRYIQNNSNNTDHYYIGMAQQVGNPEFKNELAYPEMNYPDAGYRLLSLYRYWNMIRYFFPYKHLIGRDWNEILPEFIPRFIKASDSTDYSLSTLALISSIQDTHANIWSPNSALEAYRGNYTFPFQARFIENKLTVTGYYADTLEVKQKFKLGDVITSIDGTPVENLIAKYLPITSASNYSTQLRDLPRTYLLRSHEKMVPLVIERAGKAIPVLMETTEQKKLDTSIDRNPDPLAPAYSLIDGDIGYIYPGKYKNTQLPEIKKLFADAKGIIVDMRCYPSEFMVFTFVPFVKTGDSPFVKFTVGSVQDPGFFLPRGPLAIKPSKGFKGKVVVIVNERTQSQAEYTTMALQSSPNVSVIGSTTAGADGNVSYITLPGGIRTAISGIGVLYPDGTETQRKGVKIDHVIEPTIKGIISGQDELLEKAKKIIKGL